MTIIDSDDLDKAFDTERIDQLTDDNQGEAGDVKTARVTAAIAQADGMIKNALSMLYTDAELEADAGMERLCCVFAMYFLEMRRSSFTPHIEAAYLQGQKTLIALQAGTTKLAAVDELLPSIVTMKDVYGPITRSDYFIGLPEEGIDI